MGQLRKAEDVKQDGNLEGVRGSNNAAYGLIQKEEQLFEVEFLEIAPTPIIADNYFFILLRGWMPSAKAGETKPLDLTKATLTVTGSATYYNGEYSEPKSVTVPLRATSINDWANIAIRDQGGVHRECLTRGSRNDILVDFQIPTMFLRSGTWTFEAKAVLEDDTCLFNYRLSQWLDGGLQ